MNICMKICLLVTICVTNHQNVRIHHLVLVIAAIKNFQNGRQWKLKILACLSCVTYSVVQWGNRCIPSWLWSTFKYLHYILCVDGQLYNTSYQMWGSHFHPFTMIRKDWEWCQTLSAYIIDMVGFSHNMLQQCILSGTYIFKRPYVHENMHRLRTLTVVWEHVQSCHMNLHIAAGKSVLYV